MDDNVYQRIAIVGDVYCDVVCNSIQNLPNWGGDTLCSGINFMPGGSGLNTAVHASKFVEWSRNRKPTSIMLYSGVGKDYQGDLCLSALGKEPYIVNRVVQKTGVRTGTCVVLSGFEDRCFVTDRGCVGEIAASWFDMEEILSAQHVHFAGFYNCAVLRSSAREMFEQARARGCSTSLNPQYDASFRWDGIREICPYLSVLICNHFELFPMVNCSIDSESSVNNNEPCKTVEEAATVLLNWGCELVVVTHGKEGASTYWLDSAMKLQFLKKDVYSVEVMDCTGAGDAFCGAFLVSWVSGRDIAQSLSAGCLAGMAAVRCVGGSTASVEMLQEMSDFVNSRETQYVN